jgi:hypothetical protein
MRARRDATLYHLTQIARAANEYRANYGSLPSDLGALNAPNGYVFQKSADGVHFLIVAEHKFMNEDGSVFRYSCKEELRVQKHVVGRNGQGNQAIRGSGDIHNRSQGPFATGAFPFFPSRPSSSSLSMAIGVPPGGMILSRAPRFSYSHAVHHRGIGTAACFFLTPRRAGSSIGGMPRVARIVVSDRTHHKIGGGPGFPDARVSHPCSNGGAGVPPVHPDF